MARAQRRTDHFRIARVGELRSARPACPGDAAVGVVEGDESAHDANERPARLVVEGLRRLEGEGELPVVVRALFAEDELVGGEPERRAQPADDPQGRLGGPRLVTIELGEVHPGTLGELGLGESRCTPGGDEALGKLHDSPSLPVIESSKLTAAY